ncbi:MAG TPA: insulinase family protein, partial [Acidobacteriota bacterium]|nr:insulinase family protein [Acidobacteriota bacterium]
PSIDQVASAPGLSYRHLRRGTGRYLVLAGLPTVGWAHSDHLKVELLKAALGLGRASLLGRYLVEPGKAHSATVSRQSTARRGLLSVVAVPDRQQIDAAEAALLTQLEILRANPLSPLLLERAKAQVVRAYYQRLQSLRGRAEALAEAEWKGDYKSRDRLAQRVDKITAEELRQAARRYLQTSRLSLLEDFPQSAEERSFDSLAFAQTMKVLVDAAASEQTAAMNVLKEAADAEGLHVDFEFAPDPERSDMRRTSVLRGPEIFFQEQHDLPLLDLGLFFVGGRVDEEAESAGVTELLLHCMLRGGGEDTPQMPLERLEAMGADFEIVNETDFFGYRATLLSPYREEFFGALLRWLRSVELSSEKLELEKKRLLAKLRENEGELGSDLEWVRRQLFQDQTYGESRYGTASSLASLGIEQVSAWKESKVDKRHPWLIMRGDFDGTTFLRPFISRLSNSRLEGVTVGRPKVDEYGYATEAPRPEGAGEEMASVAREGQIIIGYAGPSKGTREEWMTDVLENLLEGLGGRLEVLLQEEGKDGVPVRILHEAGQRKGALFVLAESDPEKADAVQEKIVADLAALRSVVIRPLTWNYALDSTITDFYIRQQQGSDYTLELARNILAGQTTRFEKAYINAIRQARPSDLQALAAIYFPVPEEDDSEEADDQETP